MDKAGARIVSRHYVPSPLDDPSVAAEAKLPFDESGGRQADTLRKRNPKKKIRTHESRMNCLKQ